MAAEQGPEAQLILHCTRDFPTEAKTGPIGTLHVWDRLAWIADIAELIDIRKELDWVAAIA